MAQPATQIVNEQDEDAGQTQQAEPTLSPFRQPALRTASQQAQEERFEIVEVDEAGQRGDPQPLPAAGAQQPTQAQPGEQDGDLEQDQTLAEQNVAQRPLVETGPDGQPLSRSKLRRTRRRQGQEQTVAENRRLQGQLQAMADEMEALRAGIGQGQVQLAGIAEERLRDRVSSLDTELAQINREYEQVEGQVFDAVQANDRAAGSAAFNRRDQLALKRFEINAQKRQIEAALQNAGRQPAGQQAPQDPFRLQPRQQQAPQQQARPQQPAPLSLNAQRFADEFSTAHPWLNPNGGDLDSDIALRIDAEVARRFDPETAEYWDELEDQLADRLPHRFEPVPAARTPAQGRTQQPRLAATNGAPVAPQPRPQVPAQRRGPMVVGGGEMNGSGARPTQVVITPGRKTSLIEIGAVNDDGTIRDQKKFSRMLKQYAEFDRAQPAARQ